VSDYRYRLRLQNSKHLRTVYNIKSELKPIAERMYNNGYVKKKHFVMASLLHHIFYYYSLDYNHTGSACTVLTQNNNKYEHTKLS